MEGTQTFVSKRDIRSYFEARITDLPEDTTDTPTFAPDISKEGLKVSETEYWKTWYDESDFSYEWNNGYLEVKPVSDYKGYLMSRWFIFLLHAFIDSHPIARTVGLDVGFRLAFPGHTSIRKPDYAVILNTNPINIHLDDASYHGIYDLCIEILSYTSPAASERDTVQKKMEYAKSGVQEYYILDARGLETAFYQLDRYNNYAPLPAISGDIIQSCVLPGFQLSISDLYKQPELKSLIHNPIYRHYVMLDYQKEKQRAEKEKQRAEMEKQHAEMEKERAEQSEALLLIEKQRSKQEKQRAEQLAAKLISLGIRLDDI